MPTSMDKHAVHFYSKQGPYFTFLTSTSVPGKVPSRKINFLQSIFTPYSQELAQHYSVSYTISCTNECLQWVRKQIKYLALQTHIPMHMHTHTHINTHTHTHTHTHTQKKNNHRMDSSHSTVPVRRDIVRL